MHRWLMIAALMAAPAGAHAADTAAPVGRLPETVLPTHYQLTFAIDPRQREFSGKTTIDVELRVPLTTIWMHGLGLKVTDAAITYQGHSVAAHYEEVDHDTGVARLTTGATLPAGKAVLHFTYTAPFQDSPQGLYREQVGQDWYAFSQFEAIDARRAFPGFDEPRFKTPFDVSVTATAGDVVISNGAESKAAPAAGGTLHTFQATRPLPTYLVAFAVGPLEALQGAPIPANEVRSTPLPLRIIGPRGNPKRFQFALEQTPELIRRLESYFGSPFPYPKIDLIASPSHLGAMENAGAIIFEEDLLAYEHPPTPRQESDFGVVTAHELAHQWFGDLVTPAWWDDIWLNESFAEWMGSKIADEWRPKLGVEQEQLNNTLAAMKTDALRAGRPIHQPVENNLQISSTFDGITYQKGAGVIGMIESYLGVERFQRGVRLHMQRHPYGNATAAEFFASMAEASGDRGVIDAFESFVNQAGVPLIAVARMANGSLELTQSQYRLLGPADHAGDVLWKIPFCAQFTVSGAPPAKQCTMLADHRGTLVVPEPLKSASVFPNANGAGYYRFTVDSTLWQSLLSMAPQLPAREAVTLADSAAAAFDAGHVSFADLYKIASALASHPDRTTTLSLGYRLAEIHDSLASAAERPLIERAIVALYGERLRKLGFDATPGRYAADPPEQQLLRRQLIGLVGLTGRDPAVRAALVPIAERSVADPSKVEALLRWRVWAIGLQEHGAPILAALKALASNGESQARSDAGVALGAGEGSQSGEVLNFSLDPKVDSGTAFRIVYQQISDPTTRTQAMRWLAVNGDAAMARLPTLSRDNYAKLGEQFCSADERSTYEAEIGKKVRLMNGGEIAVARTLETIDDCIALRAALGNSIETTLAKTAH